MPGMQKRIPGIIFLIYRVYSGVQYQTGRIRNQYIRTGFAASLSGSTAAK